MTVQDAEYAPIIGPYVRIVCDDNGRHRTRSVARFGRRAGEWVPAREDDREPDEPRRGGVAATSLGWRLVCPKCGRDVRAHRARLVAILDGLAGVGVDTVSLAALASRI